MNKTEDGSSSASWQSVVESSLIIVKNKGGKDKGQRRKGQRRKGQRRKEQRRKRHLSKRPTCGCGYEEIFTRRAMMESSVFLLGMFVGLFLCIVCLCWVCLVRGVRGRYFLLRNMPARFAVVTNH